MASNDDYTVMAKKAELDVNSFQSKTGAARPQGLSVDESGVNNYAERKFPGADVKYGDGLSREQRGAVPRTPAPTPADAFASTYGRQQQQQERDSGLGAAFDLATQGKEASRANVGDKPSIGGNKFPGLDYFVPESVPGSIAAEGWEPPESVVRASKETEV